MHLLHKDDLNSKNSIHTENARKHQTEDRARDFRRLNNAIHWINHYPADSVDCFVNTYPLDSDLSGRSVEFRTHPNFYEILISKSDFGPVKLPGLSRNGPLAR